MILEKKTTERNSYIHQQQELTFKYCIPCYICTYEIMVRGVTNVDYRVRKAHINQTAAILTRYIVLFKSLLPCKDTNKCVRLIVLSGFEGELKDTGPYLCLSGFVSFSFLVLTTVGFACCGCLFLFRLLIICNDSSFIPKLVIHMFLLCLTPMLLVANIANTKKRRKNAEKWLKPWHMGTQRELFNDFQHDWV